MTRPSYGSRPAAVVQARYAGAITRLSYGSPSIVGRPG
ncbi:hypothetical protein FB565_001261 [Actinoplanes lutulentus]|uniref:Uncharacterized protein n=1 Tax=Actinoplanes lutulentus TaxID=1287878 RepID=A0A327ZJZ1_9ACTN|nr:hypothetical protein [Actinoplanes lutulentus]RAK39477.1 hypothetical protein B0I29_10413 [Actinoplanes lutulentus]